MYNRKNNHLSVSIVLLSLFLIGIIFYDEDIKSLTQFPFSTPNSQKIQSHENPLPESNINEQQSSKLSAMVEDDEDMEFPPESCDIFDGNWVFDDLTRPLYREEECEFLTEQVTCLKNGRQESMYQKWRWQPKDCNLPKLAHSVL